MKYLALFVAMLGTMMVLLPTGTALYDSSYADIAGDRWVVIKPIFTVSFIGGIVVLISLFVIVVEFNAECRKEKAQKDLDN